MMITSTLVYLRRCQAAIAIERCPTNEVLVSQVATKDLIDTKIIFKCFYALPYLAPGRLLTMIRTYCDEQKFNSSRVESMVNVNNGYYDARWHDSMRTDISIFRLFYL